MKRVVCTFATNLLATLCATGIWSSAPAVAAAGGPWPVPVPGYQAPEAGEHPRLLFRRGELSRLRQAAATPEGRAIVARLRVCLNGSDGESMPTKFGVQGKVAQDGSGEDSKAPDGMYSFSHTAGFGFLYQLTGDKKYAELGRQSMERALEGFRDRDQRYSFKAPFGALRAGPSLGWSALGYDLCYDGWEPAYRNKIAQALQDYNEGQWMSLPELVRGARQKPGSNHWGMQVGGGALAVLALMNDPGVDMGKIGPLLEESRKAMVRNMTEGFGDGGFFAEGDGTGSMSSHITFLSALQAWRVGGGQDFISPRPNAQWMALKWIFLSIPKGPEPNQWFWPQRGAYPHNIWSRAGLSGGGYFGIGFGGVTEEQKPALLWFYNKHLKALDEKNGTPFDTPSPYPHHAICSFVNWPWGMAEKNPAEVLPKCYRDTKWSFFAFRNRWQDENDIVITTLTKDSKGNFSAKADGALQISAFGKRSKWGRAAGNVSNWAPASDGSAVLTMADGTSLAIDFSKASGAEAMLVTTGQAEGKQVSVAGRTLTLKFFTAGTEPEPRTDGDKVHVGEQTISLANGKLSLGKMAAPLPR